MRDERNNRSHPRSAAARRFATVGLFLVGGCVATLPSVAVAAPRRTLTVNYRLTVKAGALASGRTVNATATVSTPRPRFAAWWSRSTVSSVVRKGVNGNRQTPYSSQGYACTPVVGAGTTTTFTCTRSRPGVNTAVKLTFAVTFAAKLGSGAPANEFPIVVAVSDQAANGVSAVQFANAQLDPYPTSIFVPTPVFTASQPSRLLLPKNAVVISNSTGPLTASLQTAVQITGGGSTLDGNATIAGATKLTISVNGHAAVTVPNGPFSLPLN